MDSQYEVDSTQHTTTTTSSSTEIGFDRIYLKSIDSILKIVEMVLSLIVFICISSHAWYSLYGGGWVQFVSISCLITVLILWIFFMLRIIYKLPGPWTLIILIYYIVYSVFYLITMILCAVQASNHQKYQNLSVGGLVAAAIFSFIIVGVLAVDTFFQFRKFQEGQQRPAGSTNTTGGGTVTTTHTTYETRTQY